eukprot:scaffold1651_cov317-Pinguiococcus_pyrenoidosus.AAC.23
MAFLLAFLLSFAACEAFAPAPKLRTARQPTVSLSATTEEAGLEVGTAGLDWENLGFQYRETRGHVKVSLLRFWRDPFGGVELHFSAALEKKYAGCLTLDVRRRQIDDLVRGDRRLVAGEACGRLGHHDERWRHCSALRAGLKAFAQPDGSVKLFRPQANAARLKSSCERIRMPPPSEAEFVEACKMAVRANLDYVPPYGSGGALYLRPLLIGTASLAANAGWSSRPRPFKEFTVVLPSGTGPRIGLQPAEEYAFLVICTPVGDYYKGGLGSPVTAVVVDEFDRAAPRGVGNVKVRGSQTRHRRRRPPAHAARPRDSDF